MLVSHETGHLLFTERYIEPQWELDVRNDFHYFVNVAEDYRIEEIIAARFPGFVPIKDRERGSMLELIRAREPCQPDPAWLSFAINRCIEQLEKFKQDIGTTKHKVLADEFWEVCNSSPTTQILATGLMPIFEKLYEEEHGKKPNPVLPAKEGEETTPVPLPTRTPNLSQDAMSTLIHYAPGTKPHTEKEPYDGDSWKRFLDTNLADKLTIILRDQLKQNAEEEWKQNLKRGKLVSRKAFRTKTGNMHVFKKKQAIGGLDYTIGLLVDCSGSMRNYIDTTKIIICLLYALERLEVKKFVLPYSNGPIPEFYKASMTIQQSLADRGDALANAVYHAKNGTHDAISLQKALEIFKEIPPESRKIMFNITDGHTGSPNDSEIVLHKLRNAGVFCIRLHLVDFDTTVRNYEKVNQPRPFNYNSHIPVSSTKDLAVVLPNTIRKFMRFK